MIVLFIVMRMFSFFEISLLTWDLTLFLWTSESQYAIKLSSKEKHTKKEGKKLTQF